MHINSPPLATVQQAESMPSPQAEEESHKFALPVRCGWLGCIHFFIYYNTHKGMTLRSQHVNVSALNKVGRIV